MKKVLNTSLALQNSVTLTKKQGPTTLSNFRSLKPTLPSGKLKATIETKFIKQPFRGALQKGFSEKKLQISQESKVIDSDNLRTSMRSRPFSMASKRLQKV